MRARLDTCSKSLGDRLGIYTIENGHGKLHSGPSCNSVSHSNDRAGKGVARYKEDEKRGYYC